MSILSASCSTGNRFGWFLCSMVFIFAPATGVAEDIGPAVQQAVQRVSPAVVRIRIVGTPDRTGQVRSQTTTGVVVSRQGEVVSSSFGFTGQPSAVFVETASGDRRAAMIVAQDHVRKLVLLSCEEAEDWVLPDWSMDRLEVGAWAVAAGRFYRTQHPSASLGIISALNRVHGMAIQTDAKVSPVNYGGPLLNIDGQVLGILVPIAPGSETIGVSAGVQWYDSGIGFAIPAADVSRAVRDLRSGRDRLHGILGVRMRGQNALSTDVTVETVHPGSPANEADLLVGDRIETVNGESVARVGVFENIVRRTAAGETIELVVRRAEERLQKFVTLTDRLPLPQPGWLGIVPWNNLHDTSDPDAEDKSVAAAEELDTDNKEFEDSGVVVGVIPESPAALAGLSSNAVITKVGEEAVSSVTRLRKLLSHVTADRLFDVSWHPVDSPENESALTIKAKKIDSEVIFDRGADVAAMLPPADEDWESQLIDIDDHLKLRLLAPQKSVSGSGLGVMIFLPNVAPAPEVVVRDWMEVCRRHHVVLGVLHRDDGLPVRSTAALGHVMAQVAGLGAIDQDRIALLAESIHSEFALQAVLSVRLRPLKNVVFLGTLPAVSGRPLDSLRSKIASLLLVAEEASTAESAALLQSTVEQLRSAGADVLRDDGSKLPTTISRWLLSRKIR